MRRARFTAAAMATLLLMGAACSSGGGDDSDSGAGPTGGGAATTARSGAAPGEDAFCDFVRGFNDRFGRIDLGLADPQRFRTVMEDAAAAIAGAQSNAPEAVRADVATLNTYFQRFLDSLRQVNFDLTRLRQGTIEQLQAPEFTAASARLDEYQRTRC